MESQSLCGLARPIPCGVYGMAKKRPELSCKGKDLRISAALKSELNLFSLFQTFSYVLSTVSSSDEEKKGEVAASFLMY